MIITHLKQSWKGALLLWVASTCTFTVIVSVQSSYFNVASFDLAQVFYSVLLEWFGWSVMTIVIVWLTRKFPIERSSRFRNSIIHIAFSLSFAALHFWVNYSLHWLGGIAMQGETLRQFYQHMIYVSGFTLMVMLYWITVALTLAIDNYKRYQEQTVKAVKLESQLARAELNALKMQLHPHFLFNTLNSISSLIYKNPDDADQMISRLGDFLRITLEQSAPALVSLREELRFLQCYLDIESVRFQDRLKVTFNIEPNVMNAEVPYLILQPLVENALKHGVSQTLYNAEVMISASIQNGQVSISIQDNGIGESSLHRDGIGLSNTRLRLQHFYGSAASVTAENKSGGNGFLSKVVLPFKESISSKQFPTEHAT